MTEVYIAPATFAEFNTEPIDMIKSKSFGIHRNELGRKLNEEEIIDRMQKCEGVIAGTENYCESVLSALPRLKVISRLGVGLDNIDMIASKKKNIKVLATNSPAPAVAELVLGLILDLSRKITLHNNQIRAGTWEKNMGSLLSGKTVGIIGLGTIGKKLVEITKGLQLDYLAFDKFEDLRFAQKNNVEYCGFNELLERSDIVSIHLSLSDETNELLDSNALVKMKSTAILINSSRGECVNEAALKKALDEKRIAGAGLDVYLDEPYKGCLLECDNVITTPHIGSYAREIRIKMEMEAVENLIKGLTNE